MTSNIAPDSADLMSHCAISSWGGRRYLPYVFTEHGAIMAANVLNSARAVEMSVYVSSRVRQDEVRTRRAQGSRTRTC